jgi:hypothetical protein
MLAIMDRASRNTRSLATEQGLRGMDEIHSRREWTSRSWLPRGFLQELFARFDLRPDCGIERRDEGRRMR